MNIRREDQTLLCSDLYKKMSVKFVLEAVKFPLQLSRYLLLRVHKDVLDWSQQSVTNTFRWIDYIHIQLLSHLQMKSTTSFIMSGNSVIVLPSSREVGTLSSLLSWPASTWMLFARLFIASRVASWVFKCCKNNQQCYWHWKQKMSQLCIRPRYKKIRHVWQESAASS